MKKEKHYYLYLSYKCYTKDGQEILGGCVFNLVSANLNDVEKILQKHLETRHNKPEGYFDKLVIFGVSELSEEVYNILEGEGIKEDGIPSC